LTRHSDGDVRFPIGSKATLGIKHFFFKEASRDSPRNAVSLVVV